MNLDWLFLRCQQKKINLKQLAKPSTKKNYKNVGDKNIAAQNVNPLGTKLKEQDLELSEDAMLFRIKN